MILLSSAKFLTCQRYRASVYSPKTFIPYHSDFREVSHPYSVSSTQKRHNTGASLPAMLRLQVFSTSWRFIPLSTAWPYFMPFSLIGFTL